MGGHVSAAEAAAGTHHRAATEAGPQPGQGLFGARHVSNTPRTRRYLSVAHRRTAQNNAVAGPGYPGMVTSSRHRSVHQVPAYPKAAPVAPPMDVSDRSGCTGDIVGPVGPQPSAQSQSAGASYGDARSRPDAPARRFPPPIPPKPRNFDWRTAYYELHVQLEKARTRGDHYAVRAAERAIGYIDGTLMSTCELHHPVSRSATPEAMYEALLWTASEIRSTTRNSRAGGSRKFSRVLRELEGFIHRKAFELRLREREFSALLPAAVSPEGAIARGESATAGGAAQSAVASPVAAAEVDEGPERPLGGLTGVSRPLDRSVPRDLKAALAAWPTRFGSLKERRDFHRDTGNTAVARLYDAAIQPIVSKLRDALILMGLPPSEADVLEPEAAFTKLSELRLQKHFPSEQRYARGSIAKHLQTVIQITFTTQARLADRTDEFAALLREAPRPGGPVTVSDPRALESWLRLEATIARADEARSRQEIHSPAALPPHCARIYFDSVLLEHANGTDPWSASIAYLRDLIARGRPNDALALQNAHRRLLRAMADPTLQQPGEAIRVTLPAPCRADATGPESLNLSRSTLQTSPLAGPLKIIRKEVNPWFARIDNQPGPGLQDERQAEGSTNPGPMSGAQ